VARSIAILTVGAVTTQRLSQMLRWLGLTLVVLLLLQLLTLLVVWNWSDEGFRQLLVDRLVTQSPMALVGLLLMAITDRLERVGPDRTPLGWLVGIVSALLALALVVAVPISIGGDQALTGQADQALAAKEGQLSMARTQAKDPRLVEQLIDQAERAGQIPSQATDEQKRAQARGFIDRQLKQAEDQLQQARQARNLAVNQRRFGATGSAVVLAVAFGLLALTALI
jgi:hypothetical protein